MFPGAKETVQKTSIPAPMGGINALDALMGMSGSQCIFAYNLIPSQYGLTVRTGYKEWATNVTGAEGVKTIIPVKGFIDGQDRMFAVTSDGIYETTASTNAPPKRLNYATKTSDAGWAQWTNFTTTAGQFTPICDQLNGYSYFDPVANTFTTPTFGGGAGQVSGVDPALFSFVISYKGRLWFIERDSARAWYLPVGLLTGAATVFDFGNKFIFGGQCAALYPFTINGGTGAEDYLVALSTSGDVVVYAGTDPSSAAAWDQKGIWYIGDLPKGRRIADVYGGDLLLLSVYGVLPLSTLMGGVDISDKDRYRSRNITTLISVEMQISRIQRGWEMKSFPKDNLLVVSTPKQIGQPYKQFVQNTDTKGWAIYKDLIYQTAEIWKGELYIGTADNRILQHTGNVDGTKLDGSGSVQINWSLMTVYAGDPNQKIPSLVRAYFLSQLTPVYSVSVLFDFQISDPAVVVAYTGSSGSAWDAGIWDAAIWGGGTSPFESIVGVGGIGHYMAVYLSGSSISDTRLLGFDIAFRQGGYL